MIKRLLIFLAIAALLFPLISCSRKGPVQRVVPVKKPATAKPAPAAPAISIAAPLQPTVEAKRRNPFQSYIALSRGEGSKRVKGPLECCELGVFKLHAVVLSPDGSFALVQAPDGKRYIVRKGDIMGSLGGRIIRIDNKSITVREVLKNGKVVSSKDTELELPKERLLR